MLSLAVISFLFAGCFGFLTALSFYDGDSGRYNMLKYLFIPLFVSFILSSTLWILSVYNNISYETLPVYVVGNKAVVIHNNEVTDLSKKSARQFKDGDTIRLRKSSFLCFHEEMLEY